MVFIAKSEFFSKKPSFVSNKFIFREILHFNYLKRAFPAFCKFFGPIGGQKLGNARNSKSAKSGVSQIHLRQLFHFINARCNSLPVTKFVISKISTNRPKQKIFF